MPHTVAQQETELLRQEIPNRPLLALELSIRHVVHQLTEVLLREMGARPLEAFGDVRSHAGAPRFFQVRVHGMRAAVTLSIQPNHPAI